MKLLLATLPDETAEQSRWLEEHLLGLDLAGIVAELKALRGRRNELEASLEESLGDALPMILEHGLSSLAPEQLRTLLKNPELLIQLQTRIFLDGSEYWTRIPVPAGDVKQSVDRGRQQLQLFLATESKVLSASSGGNGSSTEIGNGDGLQRRGVAWYRRPFVVSFATAAAVLAAVFVVRPLEQLHKPQFVQGWGWSKSGAINNGLPAKAYLSQLSTSANDWFNKRPETPEALSKRLIELRQGCNTLILSSHQPLKPEDKAWLIERCQAWAKKFDQHLADVEAGKDPLQIRNEADETVNKLMKALSDRSTKV